MTPGGREKFRVEKLRADFRSLVETFNLMLELPKRVCRQVSCTSPHGGLHVSHLAIGVHVSRLSSLNPGCLVQTPFWASDWNRKKQENMGLGLPQKQKRTWLKTAKIAPIPHLWPISPVGSKSVFWPFFPFQASGLKWVCARQSRQSRSQFLRPKRIRGSYGCDSVWKCLIIS